MVAFKLMVLDHESHKPPVVSVALGPRLSHRAYGPRHIGDDQHAQNGKHSERDRIHYARYPCARRLSSVQPCAMKSAYGTPLAFAVSIGPLGAGGGGGAGATGSR